MYNIPFIVVIIIVKNIIISIFIMIINITHNGILDNIEKYIIHNIINLPINYGEMKEKDINTIINKVYKKYNINLSSNIIKSINSSYMKNHIIENHRNLYKYGALLEKYYPVKKILSLSSTYKLSPITIIKYIFEKKYKKKLAYLAKNINLLDIYDRNQLYSASSDNYYQLDQTNMHIESEKFEKNVEEFLIKNKIQYVTQEQLTKEQIEINGKPINTPDFLIKSQFVINGKKINWIDAKNFYGSNIKFIKTKINKQIIKYNQAYGSGCIIFSLGYNQQYKTLINTMSLNYNFIEELENLNDKSTKF